MKHTERILKYLDGKLSQQELMQFRNELKTNPELKEELDIHLLVDDTLSHDNELRFRKRLREAELEYLENREREKNGKLNRIIRRKAFRWTLYFSGIAAALFMMIFFITSLNSSPDRIYKKYYTKYSQDMVSRSGNAGMLNLLTQGVSNYRNGNYEDAIADLTLYIGSNNNTLTANFYRGLSFMEKKNYEMAANDFKQVLQENFTYYHDHSKWYLALCYLRLEEYDKASRYFLELKYEDAVYADEASKILKYLD